MSSIKYHIANAAGKLSNLEKPIVDSFEKAAAEADRTLGIDKVDVIFSAIESDSPLGVYGYTPGPNIIYTYIDVGFHNFSAEALESTLLHEMHHAMRWRGPGYGRSLGEAIITEGLAALYEQEVTDTIPPYAKVKLKDTQTKEAKKQLNSSSYDHGKWFYGGGKIDNWFGYSLGYKLCKKYSKKSGKKASELVDTEASVILRDSF